jgi:hypothetical protein
VRRFLSNRDATLSDVSIDGAFECYGLEDERRDVKVAGETRIPPGMYRVGVRTEGRFHTRYSARFARFHAGMLHVLDVPGFEFILIHVGNTDDDTAGCLLTGQSCAASAAGSLTVGASVPAYKALYAKAIAAALAGELTIHYIDED